MSWKLLCTHPWRPPLDFAADLAGGDKLGKATHLDQHRAVIIRADPVHFLQPRGIDRKRTARADHDLL